MYDFSLDSIPTEPGIYAMYDRNDKAAYVGESGNLHQRIKDHIVNRDSTAVTRLSPTMLNPDYVCRIRWWLCDSEFDDRVNRQAAELVAFDVLRSSHTSRASFHREAQERAREQSFREDMEDLFNGEPAGCYYPPTMQNLVNCVSKLCKRVSELESEIDRLKSSRCNEES